MVKIFRKRRGNNFAQPGHTPPLWGDPHPARTTRTNIGGGTKTASEAMPSPGFPRRAFLVSSGAAGIGVVFGNLIHVKEAFGQAAPLSPNAWVRVGTDNIVTIFSPAAEMGQGVMTSMPL